MNNKYRVSLSICSNEFIINSDDNEQYMLDIAAEVERKINSVAAHNPALSLSKAALFSALEYCDEVRCTIKAADNLREQIKEYLEETASAKSELNEARKTITSLNHEIQILKSKLNQKGS